MKEELRKYFNSQKEKGFLKEHNFQKIYSEFLDFQKSFFPKRKKNDLLKDDFDFLHLIYYRNSALWLNINTKFDFLKHEKLDDISKLFYDYINILTLTQNNLLTIDHLCYNGFDHQAFLIVRNHLELFELALSILGDEEMYQFYKELIGQGENAINRSIKFSNTSKTNQKILKKIREKPGFEFYDGFFKDLSEFKINNYKKYSASVHPDRTTVWISAHASTDDETLKTCYGGKRSKRTQDILYDIFLIEVILFQYILAVQINSHKMNFEKYGKDAEEMAFLVAGVWHLYGIKIKKYYKK